MTSHPEAEPADARPASQRTKPLREIAALVLVAATAVLLFVAVLDLLIPYSLGSNDFTARSRESFFNFVGVSTIGFPLLAVLLATHLGPPVARARLITTVALVEYAVSAFFGTLFGLLVGVVVIADDTVRGAFEALLVRLAWSAVLGIAAYAVYQVWLHQRPMRRPAPQPGMYGQPQPPQGYGYPPAAYPQQGNVPPGHHQPGYPQQGYGQPGYPPGAQQGNPVPGFGPAYPPPPQYGQPGYPPPGYGQPAAYPQSAPPAPVSTPPHPNAPGSAPPYAPNPSSPAPQGAPAGDGAEPTQTISPGGDERTRLINPAGPGDENPGEPPRRS